MGQRGTVGVKTLAWGFAMVPHGLRALVGLETHFGLFESGRFTQVLLYLSNRIFHSLCLIQNGLDSPFFHRLLFKKSKLGSAVAQW